MKDKILVIGLLIIFIGILFGISKMLDNQNVQQENIIEKLEEENMSVLEITSENFEDEVLKSEKVVLVDFFADWCGPCKILSPIIEQVASENDKVKVCKVNVDNEQELAIKYGVMSIPTLVVIKDGQETNRSVGVIDKSEILNMIK